MAGTPFIDGPAYVANAAADLYVPPVSNVYAMVRQIHLANKDSTNRSVSLYVGATGGSAGGTEILGGATVVANDVLDLYFPAGLKLTSTTFLSGVASSASTIVCTIMGELYAT